MSKSAKHYNVRERINRYRKKIKEAIVSRYYTEASKSQNRKNLRPGTGDKQQ